jgi:DNA-binding transcriptional regulator WhiA
MKNKNRLAYIIGIAIGDGNLSNPNKRATRLRITCDLKYKNLIENIKSSLEKTFPKNKISIVKRKDNCIDISCYSNKLEKILGWKHDGGSKYKQNISVPKWIKANNKFIIACLRGLFETDGSIYFDRKYKMANFTTIIPNIAKDVQEMISGIGFQPNIQILKSKNKKTKYTIRISKNAEKFINLLGINKN